MNYYSFHIGDYRGATTHLTNEEDLCYRRLLDLYYDKDGIMPDLPSISRRVRFSIELVESILNEFFTLQESNWIHARAQREIDSFREKSEVAKRSAEKRWCKGNANAMPTQCEGNANQEPITNNQYTPLPPKGVEVDEVLNDFIPIAELASPPPPAPVMLEDFEQFWNAYPENRRKSKLECQRQWYATRNHRPPIAELLDILSDHKDSQEWKRWQRDDGGKYIPSTLTWLSDHRWHDGLTWTNRRVLGASTAQEKASKKPVDEAEAWEWLKSYCEDPDPTPYNEWPEFLKKEYAKHLKQTQAA